MDSDHAPQFVFSREQVRTLDRLAVEEFAMPSILLMENAARGCAELITRRIDPAPGHGTLIICGPGNNGGDGLAIARHLANAGRAVALWLPCGDPQTPDARTNLEVIRAMRLPFLAPDLPAGPEAVAAIQSLGARPLLVDALLGTGIDRPLTGRSRDVVAWVNDPGVPVLGVVAIDIPSGMDADSGEPAGGAAGMAVRADWTLTLAGLKQGFLGVGAQARLGEVAVVDIGVPMELVRRLGRPLRPARPDPPNRP